VPPDRFRRRDRQVQEKRQTGSGEETDRFRRRDRQVTGGRILLMRLEDARIITVVTIVTVVTGAVSIQYLSNVKNPVD